MRGFDEISLAEDGAAVPAGATGFVVALLAVFMAQNLARLVSGTP